MHYISLLRNNRDFRLLYIGQIVSFFGTMMTGVVLPYQIYQQTKSVLMVGLLSLFQLLPLLVTALLGGVFADTHNRRYLLLLTEILLAVGCLILTFNASLAHPSLLLIFIVAPVMSAITGFHRPSLDGITQQIIGTGDFHAVGTLLSFKYSFCMIAGPAWSGVIIAHYGIVPTFLIDFGTFLVSLIALWRIKHIPKPVQEVTQSILNSLKAGFRYAISRQELIGSYMVDFVAMIFGMPTALFPAIAQHYGGAKTLGLIYAAPAVGSLIISFFTGWTKSISRHGVAIAVSAILWGITIIAFGLVNNLWLALFFLALSGALDMISGLFRSVMWNQTIPTEMRGRLSGIEMISYLSGPRLGDTEAGLVAAAFGITFSIVSGGLLCVFGVAVCCYCLPKFWNYKADKLAH